LTEHNLWEKLRKKLLKFAPKLRARCTVVVYNFGQDFVRKNKTEVCERVKHTIKPNLDEFVFRQFFLKYCKLSNFKLLNGQLFV